MDDPTESAYAAWKREPSQENSGKMLAALDPTIDSAIRAHAGPNNPIVKGKARHLALEAVKTYEPARGKLASHVYGHLRGLKRYAAQAAMPIKVPERVMLDRNALTAASGELADDLGRDPTDDELADHTGLSTKRIHYIRTYNPAMSEGFFSNLGEDKGGLNPAVKSPQTGAWLQMVYSDLSAQDKFILERTLGMNGQRRLENREIAAKLRISPSNVSQRKAAIQKILDQESALSPFGS